MQASEVEEEKEDFTITWINLSLRMTQHIAC
jgi:hypothetical protein